MDLYYKLGDKPSRRRRRRQRRRRRRRRLLRFEGIEKKLNWYQYLGKWELCPAIIVEIALQVNNLKSRKTQQNHLVFLMADLSHLELQLWGCGVLLSHMAKLHTCQCVKHSSCMPSAAVWHPLPANRHLRGTGTATPSQLEAPHLGGLPKILPLFQFI